MEAYEHVILEALEEANVLRVFAAFYDRYSTSNNLKKLRNIYSHTDNPLITTEAIATRDFDANFSHKSVVRLHELVMAFIRKSSFRQPVPESQRRGLLKKQNYRCAICGCAVDMHAHADHIVPFKYVGDELTDNLQMLCSACNTKKNADLYYQIKLLLGLV